MKKKLHLKDLDVALNFSAIHYCAPDWSLDAEWAKGLRDYDLWYVWGGLGHMLTSDGPIDLYPGQCVWMRPGRRYEATHDPKAPLRVTAIHFQLKHGKRILRPDEFIPPVEVFEPIAPDYFRAVMAHIVDLRFHFGLPDAATLLLKSLLMEIATEALRRKPGSARDRHHKLKLNPIIAMVREQPERWFAIGELAAKSGYSTDHFVRLFRTVTGESPKEFIIRLRLERAMALLKESSHTITQIADMLGYQDLGFFSRQFKDKVGASPDRFRLNAGRQTEA